MDSSRLWVIRNSLMAAKSILFNPSLLPRVLNNSLEILQFSGLKALLKEVRSFLFRGNQLGPDVKGRRPGRPEVAHWELHSFLASFCHDSQDRLRNNPREALVRSGVRLIHEMLRTGETLQLPSFESPLVSIVIPVFNQCGYTFQCLRSILRHTTQTPYEVIVVDDASRDDTPQALQLVKGVRVVTNAENLGFIGACNRGAQAARGDYLLFLNNDTLVTPGWLEELVQTMEGYPQCGVVGARMLYPDGTIQEAGSMLWNDGSALGYGRDGDPRSPEYSYLREVTYCSAACLLVRKEEFLMLGGFNPIFRPAYYEDTDLCLGIRERGRKVVFQPKCTIIHFEYGSSGTEKALDQMRRNQRVFADRWKHTLKRYPQYSPLGILRGRDERPGRRILVMDDRIPAPSEGSGFPRSYRMLQFLGEMGYVVTFFPLTDRTPHEPWLDRLQRQGIEVFHAPYAQVRSLIRDRAGLYDALIISRPHNGSRYLRAFRKAWPQTAIIYDAEALFSLRDIFKAHADGIELSDAHIASLLHAELAPMKEADMTTAVSPRECSFVSRFLEGVPTRVWGHPLEPRPPRTPFQERRDFLFVGGFPFPESPNEAAVLHFLQHIWPLIRAKLECRLHIVGANPPESLLAFAGESVLLAGYVADLEEYYESCRVFIAPHRFAAGLPWKVHEAMSRGIPCVVSTLMGYQLGIADGKEALLGHNAQHFASRALLAYSHEETWRRLQGNALDFIRTHCDPQSLKTALCEIVEETVRMRATRKNGHGSQ
ncbi:MAG: glycosyltransferase [Deltaproteobacteria bacterium]|nr:glycosyltransferase [Deltaproteobacteria bacterium]